MSAAGDDHEQEGEACSQEGGHPVVGAPGSFAKPPVSPPPADTSTQSTESPGRSLQPGPSPRTTGPAVDPVCLNSALPRRAGRASAYYRFFGRDCWPQGQLQGWYSAEPAKDAPAPRPKGEVGPRRVPRARFRTRMTASVPVPALQTPASDEARSSRRWRRASVSPGRSGSDAWRSRFLAECRSCQSLSPALADIIGARRARTAVMISSRSIPCR
jgi:hypothetical protein